MKVIYDGVVYTVIDITNDSYIIFIDGQQTEVLKELCEVV